MVLVDSSIYIDLLRARRDPTHELAEAFGGSNLVSCGVVRCEVLRGVTRPMVKIQLTSFFDLLVHVPTDIASGPPPRNLPGSLIALERCFRCRTSSSPSARSVPGRRS